MQSKRILNQKEIIKLKKKISVFKHLEVSNKIKILVDIYYFKLLGEISVVQEIFFKI